MKSLSKFHVLLQFLDLQKLSESRLEKLCEMHSKSSEDTRHYFNFLKCNLNLINEMYSHKKNLQEINDEQRNKMNDLEKLFQNKLSDSEKVNAQLQSQFDDSTRLINEQQSKMKDLETKIELLQKQLQNQMSSFSKELSQLQGKLESSEKEMAEVKKQVLIEGQVVASVENGLFIKAEINLKTKDSTLDTDKSKVIVSTSDAKCLGSSAYEKGERITSLHMVTSFVIKPGTYYVRCIVFNSDGVSKEIVSNSVTTSGSVLTFAFHEKKPEKISLPPGRYRLEVWGAKGGDGVGKGYCNRGNQQVVKGGLGGYSRGILNLTKKETVYVFVGEKGRSSDSSDGSCTEGGFPDGGGTKTGHYYNYTAVPGTGGGSTSIRIGGESNHARVIVAGGGGGAGGSSCFNDPGGFGGGLSGGNCSYCQSIQCQGAGTQTGSTRGLGEHDDRHGDAGAFGSGATGKYHQGSDSGGGGGGGWYGGGSGGYGANNFVSSGGGGSGWTFTESRMAAFRLGDSANASQFALSSAYYLSDEVCVGGNEEFPRPDGNGNERGHDGNGYAKITIL